MYTEELTAITDNRLTLWGLQQKMYADFWARWKEEFLRGLQERNKWYRIEENLKKGDMVLIMAENTPPSVWPLARVQDVFTGADGLVRSASVLYATTQRNAKTEQSEIIKKTLERPIQKLCILLPDDIEPATPRDEPSAV